MHSEPGGRSARLTLMMRVLLAFLVGYCKEDELTP